MNQLTSLLLYGTISSVIFCPCAPDYPAIKGIIIILQLTSFLTLKLFSRLDKVLDCHKLWPRYSTITTASEFIVFIEVHIQMLLKIQIPDKPHATDCALELYSFIDFINCQHVEPICIVKVTNLLFKSVRLIECRR